MDDLIASAGPMTVTERALFAIGAAVLVFAVLVALTALVTHLRTALALWVGLIVLVTIALAVFPVSTSGLRAQPDPATDYAAAVARFEADRDAAPPLNPLCAPKLYTHGQATSRVVVLIHGVSSCPRAFVDFAPLLFEKGDNVLVVRMPENGHEDRSTDALRNLTAQKLARFGDTTVDIAAGLGEEVVVLGISAGGTVAAWTAQNRPEVDRAVLVAPFFGLAGFGPRINMVLMRAMLLLPNVSIWKDPVLRDQYGGMPHAYQRQSTRGTGEILRLALGVYREALEGPPAAAQIALIVNAADTAVSNAVARILADQWAREGGNVTLFEFPADHALGHELIDPLEPGADPELTYPLILQTIDAPAAVKGAYRLTSTPGGAAR